MNFFSFMLHVDKELGVLISEYGNYIYGVLFAIIFGETGLVVLPFLPGDALLFIAGAFAADGKLNPWLLTFLLISAAILGNTVNYLIGRFFGKTVLEKHSRWVSPEAMDKAHRFYEKHGGKAIILSRFLPILRTFVPFVAGVSEMTFAKFQQFNILGAVLWITLFVWGGYFLGHIELLRNHLGTIAIVGFLSALVPALVGFVWQMLRGKKKTS